MVKKPRYTPPRNQTQRLAEAERHIADITRTMNQGQNRYGAYGDSCRAGIAGWTKTAEDARAKIAAGITKIF